MTGSPQDQAVDVIPLRTPARVVWETLSGIRASFPGWHVWHSIDSATWNAHRKGQEPYFGPVPDGEPVFMVSSLERGSLGGPAGSSDAFRHGQRVPGLANQANGLWRLVCIRSWPVRFPAGSKLN